MRWWLCGLVMLMSTVPGAAESAERRVALIIGNDSYVKIGALHNAANDARMMDQALRAAGFETTVKIDAKRRSLYAAIDAFAAQISASPETVGLFYYAGHGIQANGNNYLIPIDADIDSESDLEAEAVDAGKVLRAMGEAHNRLNIVVLDACRDNPLPKRNRSASRGLARMDAPTGTFIAYAAGPGQTAQDGSAGGNGVFTGELVKAIGQPGIPIEQVFKKAAAGVRAETGDKQVPWTEASLQGDFFFHAAGSAPVAAAPVSAPAPVVTGGTDPAAFELAYWSSVKDSKNPAEIKSYLDKYPKGNFAGLAKVKYDELRAAAGAAKPASQVAVANPPAERAAPAPAASPGGRGYLQMGLQWSQEESAEVAMNVVDGGAAAKAGIQNDDILVSIDGHKIESPSDLQRLLSNTTPGQSIDVGIRRHGIPSMVRNLVLGSTPPPQAQYNAPSTAGSAPERLARIAPPQQSEPQRSGAGPVPPQNGFADELWDFGVLPQHTLQYNVGSPTPMTIPGGSVITTQALSGVYRSAVLIDAWNDRTHGTLPGAIRMWAAGSAGNFNDQVQTALGQALAFRSGNNPQKPLVFFCAGVKCWESYNAALRAIQMGYREVYWYRGGVAAWQAAGLPLVPP